MRHIRNILTALGTTAVPVACGSDTNPNDGSDASPTAAPTTMVIAVSTSVHDIDQTDVQPLQPLKNPDVVATNEFIRAMFSD